jgi:hypothetical protein
MFTDMPFQMAGCGPKRSIKLSKIFICNILLFIIIELLYIIIHYESNYIPNVREPFPFQHSFQPQTKRPSRYHVSASPSLTVMRVSRNGTDSCHGRFPRCHPGTVMRGH